MTSKKLSQQTLEQLEDSRNRAEAAANKAREAFEAAKKVLESASTKLKKINLEIESRNEMTLEKALETYIASGENSRGYDWLNEKSWKGDWKDTGMRFNGSYWHETNQRVLTVWSDRRWGEAELAIQEATIMSVVDIVKSGQIDKRRIERSTVTLSKTETVNINDAKIFDIFERGLSEHYDWKLAQLQDGRWIIFDSRRVGFSWSDARKVGTLKECLEEIRTYLYYEGGDDHSSDEDD